MTAIIIAVIAAVGSLAAATYQYRAERQRAHAEADVGRETLIDARINAHLQRLDDEVEELRKRNKDLAGRVEELAHQLDVAIAYIQANNLPWPPGPLVPGRR